MSIFTSPNTPSLDLRKVILDEEDAEELKILYLWLLLDRSYSMNVLRKLTHEHMLSTLSGLESANNSSADMRTQVKLALFNDKVVEFNNVHLDPQQLADTFTLEDYTCSGTTSGSAISKYIDKELSRSNPIMKQLKKGGAGFCFAIVTDAMLNDNTALREEAQKVLNSNRFYKDYCKILVIFLGNEKDKATAVILANGKEENVVALDASLMSILSPLIIESTVTLSDGTHINNTDDRSFKELAEDAKNREKDGSQDIDELSDSDLAKALAKLMGKPFPQEGN